MVGTHELIDLGAAMTLWLGGGVILVRSAIRPRIAASAVPRARSPFGAVTVALTVLAVGLSAGAAAVHLAAAADHVAELGDLGFGFYWAAIFQGGFAIALSMRPRSRTLAWIGIAGNVALTAAWVWSRTVGLPGVDGGPEAVGLADGIVVALQLTLVGLLMARLRGLEGLVSRRHPAARIRSLATSGLVVAIGIVFLTSTIAVADAAAGHHHAAMPAGGHGMADDHAAGTTTKP